MTREKTPEIRFVLDQPVPVRRRRKRKPRKVDYAELLKPVPPVEERCPHSLKPIHFSECSQCIGLPARRVRPTSTIDS